MDSLNEYLSDSAPIRGPVPAAAAVTCNSLEDGGAALFCHQGGNAVVLLGAGASSCLHPLCVTQGNALSFLFLWIIVCTRADQQAVSSTFFAAYNHPTLNA